jgi:hypothetical protein
VRATQLQPRQSSYGLTPTQICSRGSWSSPEFAIIIRGVIIASFLFVRFRLMTGDWRSAYVQYRSNLGRGILLWLELLAGAE